MERRFVLLLLCFLLSGFSALLYQTAWMREFAFVFGTSELALAAVLAGYMGGLAVGSAIAARVAPRIRRPVLAYGVLELGIALCAVGMPFGLWALTAVYVSAFGGGAVAGEPGTLATLFRLGGAFLLLLTPTALMGATLPLLARHAVRHDDEVGPRVGALYAINTAGAIAGTVCAAFWLLPAIGLRQTVWVGAAVNGLVFLAAAALARGAPAPAEPAPRAAAVATGGAWILPLMTLSGAVSFAYEVFWVRLLSQLLGGSVYAFATMLSSFLLGITVGSAIGGRLARRHERAAANFAWTQLGIAALALGAFALADRLPALAESLGAGWKASPIANAPVAAAVLLPVALCIGATFPLAVRVLVQGAADTAAGTARVYAWNTLGAILGSIGTGFFLLPAYGFVGTATFCAATSLFLAAAAGLLASPRRPRPIVAVVAGMLVLSLLPLQNPWNLLRSFPIGGNASNEKLRFFDVGRSATVMLTERPDTFRVFTNGLPESLIDKKVAVPARSLLSHWLGLLPSLLRPDTRNLLVVGLGGGNALEGVSPAVESIDVVELEPEVVVANRSIGPERRVDPLADPRVRVIVNDARGALMLSDARYDAIVSQPSHPWTAGASHLYTREFFELAREHLTDGGVFVQWIGLAFVDEGLMRGLIATLRESFPHVHVYLPVPGGVLFAASMQPFDIARSAAQAVRDAPLHLARTGVLSAEDVAAALVLDEAGCAALAEGARPITDDHNYLATGSARIEGRLETETLLTLAAPWDPLARLPGIEPVRLAASLFRSGRVRRVSRLLPKLSGFQHDIVAGSLAGWSGDAAAARIHLAKAVAAAPDALEAHVALLANGLPPVEPSPEEVAMLRRAVALADWRDLAALDDELAEAAREPLLYQSATRLRGRWRIQSADPVRAAEAVDLMSDLMATMNSLEVAAARVEAARLSGQYEVAWVGLANLVKEMATGGPTDVSTAQRALWLADALPDHPLKPRLRARLQRALQ
ncbi:MAG: fused MFS/spermidine synthase [Myxococcota bacterium]